jgi:DNA-binding MarR family transcriptional regulator
LETYTLTATMGRTDEAVRLSDLFVQLQYKTLGKRVVEDLTDARVSLPQMQALRYIWLHEHVLIGSLSGGLAISYPSATNMVHRLVRQNLVTRTTNPADRREVQVSLTAAGRALMERVECERVARMGSVLAKMNTVDRENMLSGLHRFVQLAVEDDDDTAREVCLRCGSQSDLSCPIAELHSLQVCR